MPPFRAGQVQTARDIEWGRTRAPSGGDTGQGCCSHPQGVDRCVWASGELQIRTAGKWDTEELWKGFFLPWGWVSGSGVAGAGIWDETSYLSFATGRGDLLGPTVHQVQLAQRELNWSYDQLSWSRPRHGVVANVTAQLCWLQWLDIVTLLLPSCKASVGLGRLSRQPEVFYILPSVLWQVFQTHNTVVEERDWSTELPRSCDDCDGISCKSLLQC